MSNKNRKKIEINSKKNQDEFVAFHLCEKSKYSSLLSFHRVFITGDLLGDVLKLGDRRALWLTQPNAPETPFVAAYKLEFNLEEETRLLVHFTADERYELFVDGEMISRGPERGDAEHWFFESFELHLEPGAHILVSRVWSLGEKAPQAQMSLEHGFLLFPDDDKYLPLVGTGVASWQTKMLSGYGWRPHTGCAHGVGWSQIVDGAEFDWGHETGGGQGWIPAVHGAIADAAEGIGNIALQKRSTPTHRLKPAMLPPMLDRPCQPGKVRHVALLDASPAHEKAVRSRDCLTHELPIWQEWFVSGTSLTLPPFSKRRVIFDLENYFCARPEIEVSGGQGARLEVNWSEALYEHVTRPENIQHVDGYHWPKGHRDEIEGKFFACPWTRTNGSGDCFLPDGGERRTFSTLWWRAGRFVQLLIETASEPLTLESFVLRETRYPLEMEGRFQCSDDSLNTLLPLLVRGTQCCAHETYIDCPFYEQMMYAGDARLEALVTYVMTKDDRLPRKALRCFEWSQLLSGITQSRYPSRLRQIIPPFSLWWIAMCHDYALWRDDPAFVKSLLPAIRSVCDYFARLLDTRGLLAAPRGWNFTDWTKLWLPSGVPPNAQLENSAVLNWQAAMAFRMAGELETWFGETEIAALHHRRAQQLADATHHYFWDETRGLYADDLAHRHWSEHTQCLAVLSGLMPEICRIPITHGLLNAPDLVRTTIYFSHYLFEAYHQLGQAGVVHRRLVAWKHLVANGLKTPIEKNEPTRSDCHGWGAHPLYHFYATIAGIRPVAPGFSKVKISPNLEALQWLKVTLPHPKGEICLEIHEGKLHLELPEGVDLTPHTGLDRINGFPCTQIRSCG